MWSSRSSFLHTRLDGVKSRLRTLWVGWSRQRGSIAMLSGERSMTYLQHPSTGFYVFILPFCGFPAIPVPGVSVAWHTSAYRLADCNEQFQPHLCRIWGRCLGEVSISWEYFIILYDPLCTLMYIVYRLHMIACCIIYLPTVALWLWMRALSKHLAFGALTKVPCMAKACTSPKAPLRQGFGGGAGLAKHIENRFGAAGSCSTVRSMRCGRILAMQKRLNLKAFAYAPKFSCP